MLQMVSLLVADIALISGCSVMRRIGDPCHSHGNCNCATCFEIVSQQSTSCLAQGSFKNSLELLYMSDQQPAQMTQFADSSVPYNTTQPRPGCLLKKALSGSSICDIGFSTLTMICAARKRLCVHHSSFFLLHQHLPCFNLTESPFQVTASLAQSAASIQPKTSTIYCT